MSGSRNDKSSINPGVAAGQSKNSLGLFLETLQQHDYPINTADEVQGTLQSRTTVLGYEIDCFAKTTTVLQGSKAGNITITQDSSKPNHRFCRDKLHAFIQEITSVQKQEITSVQEQEITSVQEQEGNRNKHSKTFRVGGKVTTQDLNFFGRDMNCSTPVEGVVTVTKKQDGHGNSFAYLEATGSAFHEGLKTGVEFRMGAIFPLEKDKHLVEPTSQTPNVNNTASNSPPPSPRNYFGGNQFE